VFTTAGTQPFRRRTWMRCSPTTTPCYETLLTVSRLNTTFAFDREQELHYVTGHLLSPDHASGTAYQLAFVIRHCEHLQHYWKLTCLFNGRGAGVFELAPQKFILWWYDTPVRNDIYRSVVPAQKYLGNPLIITLSNMASGCMRQC